MQVENIPYAALVSSFGAWLAHVVMGWVLPTSSRISVQVATDNHVMVDPKCKVLGFAVTKRNRKAPPSRTEREKDGAPSLSCGGGWPTLSRSLCSEGCPVQASLAWVFSSAKPQDATILEVQPSHALIHNCAW